MLLLDLHKIIRDEQPCFCVFLNTKLRALKGRGGQFLFESFQSDKFIEPDLLTLKSLTMIRVLNFSFYKSFSNLMLKIERVINTTL